MYSTYEGPTAENEDRERPPVEPVVKPVYRSLVSTI